MRPTESTRNMRPRQPGCQFGGSESLNASPKRIYPQNYNGEMAHPKYLEKAVTSESNYNCLTLAVRRSSTDEGRKIWKRLSTSYLFLLLLLLFFLNFWLTYFSCSSAQALQTILTSYKPKSIADIFPPLRISGRNLHSDFSSYDSRTTNLDKIGTVLAQSVIALQSLVDSCMQHGHVLLGAEQVNLNSFLLRSWFLVEPPFRSPQSGPLRFRYWRPNSSLLRYSYLSSDKLRRSNVVLETKKL